MDLNRKNERCVVHKFGGTSVGSAECFERVRNIIQAEQDKRIVVVASGMGGKPKVTDLLISLMELAKKRREREYNEILDKILAKHQKVLNHLLPVEKHQGIIHQMKADLSELQEVLRAVSLMGAYNDNVTELVCGHGEIWSSRVLTAVLNEAFPKDRQFTFVDARKVLIVEEDKDQGPSILWQQSEKKLASYLKDCKAGENLVITGFIASNKEGVATTLKRDGSDFSASIFARLLHADSVTIWTDVNGVLSADPRRVPESKVLTNISYQEAMELAYFGAKVIHPKTMKPAIMESIPIIIRNTFEPEFPGTCIFDREKMPVDVTSMVSGFSTVDNLALCNLEGSGMIGVHGVASRLFGALDQAKINVVLIAQASSEHSICFAIPMSCAKEAKEVIESAFFKEIHYGDIDKIDYISPVSIIAAVGDNMSQTPGVCGKFFAALGRAKINVLGISQGSSERNISAVVRYEDSASALRAVHSAFFLSDQTISIGIIGDVKSGAGKSLLKQLKSQAEWLNDRYNVDLRVRGVYNSKEMRLHATGFDLSMCCTDSEITDTRTTVVSHPSMNDLNDFVQHIKVDHLPHWLILDLTNKPEYVDCYAKWVNERMHIISLNSAGASCSISQYKEISLACTKNKKTVNMESCIGAGLPVLTTVQNLLQTGDRIKSIEAQFSAVMGSILLEMESNRVSFSEALENVWNENAHEENNHESFNAKFLIEEITGFTSAQKAVVLSRELGLTIDVQEVKLDAVIPLPSEDYREWSKEQCFKYAKAFDAEYEKIASCASEKNKLLKLITLITASGRPKVELQTCESSHPFYAVRGSLNAVAFTTLRYSEYPLLVQGPASSPSIIASSLFGSILALARQFGARDRGGRDSESENNWIVRMSPSQSSNDLTSV